MTPPPETTPPDANTPAPDAPAVTPAPPAIPTPPKTESAEEKKAAEEKRLKSDAEGNELKVKDAVVHFAGELKDRKLADVGRVMTIRGDGRVTIAVLDMKGWPDVSPAASFIHVRHDKLVRLV